MGSKTFVKEDFVPGTVHLVDLEGTMHAQHAKGGKKDVLLVPPPSKDDPDDPLNWSPRRKLLSTISVNVYTLMVGIASAAIYSVLVPITEATDLTLADLNSGTGYMFLAFGWGCLIMQPLALQFGKRPIYIFSIFATMAVQVWSPYSTRSNGEYIANKVIQGLVGAPIESLCEVSVTDVYFTHERGFYMGMYALFLAGSNYLAPVFSGFIADSMGWEWVLYFSAIFCAAGGVFLIFFMEETNYSRGTIAGQEDRSTPSDSGIQTPITTEPEKQTATTEKHAVAEPTATEAGLGTFKPSKPKKTYIQKLRPFAPGTFSSPIILVRMMARPLIFFTFPVIFYSGFAYGSNLCWFNVLNATASLILSGEPYGFSASMVGLSYLSPLIGVFLGAAFTGYFGDWFIVKWSRRKGGIYEPEYRLWLFTASLVLIPFGLILWGVGAANAVHWFGLMVAMATIALTNTIGVQVSCTYCVDSYRELAGESMITVICVRNTMSFAIGYGITPWVTNMGYQNAFITAAFAGMAQVMTFLIFVKWGKKWRRQSTGRFLKYVKELKDAGLAH